MAVLLLCFDFAWGISLAPEVRICLPELIHFFQGAVHLVFVDLSETTQRVVVAEPKAGRAVEEGDAGVIVHI